MTLFLSFPSFLNVGSLLSLIVFMYSVLGVNLFALLAPGTALHGARSFHSVTSSAEVLLQCLTADGWAMVMVDALTSPSDGRCDAARGDCGTWLSYVYFMSFVMLGKLVLTNLVIAVILQNFSSLGDLNPDLASKDDIEAFNDAWNDIDQEATGYIWSGLLPELLMSLERPLRPAGVSTEDLPYTRRLLRALIASGHLPPKLQRQGYLEYRFLLDTLIRHSFETYNRAHFENPIEEPPAAQSMWSRFIKSKSEVASEKLPKLGVGTTAQQLRAVTALLQAAVKRIDALEAECASAHEKVDSVMELMPEDKAAVVVSVREKAERTRRRRSVRPSHELDDNTNNNLINIVEVAAVAATLPEGGPVAGPRNGSRDRPTPKAASRPALHTPTLGDARATVGSEASNVKHAVPKCSLPLRRPSAEAASSQGAPGTPISPGSPSAEQASPQTPTDASSPKRGKKLRLNVGWVRPLGAGAVPGESARPMAHRDLDA